MNQSGVINFMYSKFDSEITIRPDDIDMNNHVHYSKYLDYILAARYEQMERNYKMSMEEFVKQGYVGVVSKTHYKRPLLLSDKIIVRTQVDSYSGAQVKVNFWILKSVNEKIAADGYIFYSMISLKSGRPVRLSEEMIEKYSI